MTDLIFFQINGAWLLLALAIANLISLVADYISFVLLERINHRPAATLHKEYLVARLLAVVFFGLLGFFFNGLPQVNMIMALNFVLLLLFAYNVFRSIGLMRILQKG